MSPPPDIPGSLPATAQLAPAAAIGRYIVLSLVGKGGMGEVYAAYDPELDRKVAIKLLRVHGDQANAAEGRARLMREAQAIAKLSHPNVVVVYDVGAFQDQVFMAMEFVDGHTLSYWMHAAPRTYTDVLKVFADAGRGLAAAHEKDLIHRDFKPENVMLGANGQVRVMDFGLARVVIGGQGSAVGSRPSEITATGGDRTAGSSAAARIAFLDQDLDSTRALGPTVQPSDPTLGTSDELAKIQLTQTGAMLGTPAYMSPEQFRGLHTDARTDQFSFCVALHEALYGERPFAGSNLHALIASVTEGRVRETPRKSGVPTWVREILVRGLRVDPEERWPSMRALLAELERYGEVAQRRRFADGARDKLAGVWKAPVRGRRAATAAKAEMRRAFLGTGKRYAEDAFDSASRILDQYAQSWSAMYTDACEATHVRGEQSAEVLDLRMTSLQEALDSLKALVRVFRDANGEVVENAVVAASALPSIERCADVKSLRAVVKPPEAPAIRTVVERLRSELAAVRVSCSVGRLTEGLKAIGPIEAEARRAGYGPLVAEVLLELGKLHNERRDAEAAARFFEEAVWTAETSRHDEVAAEAAITLVYVVGDNQLRFDAGEIWARHADAILRRLGGHDQLWSWLYNNRGAMRARQGLLDEALEDQRRAVAAKEKAAGNDSPDVAVSLANIALYLDQKAEAGEAALYAERALRIMEAGLGREHPRTAILLSNYGEILNSLGRFAEARVVCQRALDVIEGETDPNGFFISFPLTSLGIACLGNGHADLALSLLERAGRIRDARDPGPALAAEVHFALARALHQKGREQARSRALAARARGEYLTAPVVPAVLREIARIDAWLATCDSSAA